MGKRGRALERRPFSRAACARGPAFLLKNVIISFPFPFNMYVYTFYACVRTHMQCAHSRKPQAVQRAPVARLPGRAPCRWPCSCGRVRFVFAPTVSRGLPDQRARPPRSRHADGVAWDASPGVGLAGSLCVPGSGAAGLGAPYQPLARLPGSPQRPSACGRRPVCPGRGRSFRPVRGLTCLPCTGVICIWICLHSACFLIESPSSLR